MTTNIFTLLLLPNATKKETMNSFKVGNGQCILVWHWTKVWTHEGKGVIAKPINSRMALTRKGDLDLFPSHAYSRTQVPPKTEPCVEPSPRSSWQFLIIEPSCVRKTNEVVLTCSHARHVHGKLSTNHINATKERKPLNFSLPNTIRDSLPTQVGLRCPSVCIAFAVQYIYIVT